VRIYCISGFGLIFFVLFSRFSISFKRSWNFLRLSLSCNIFVKFDSILCRCLSSLFGHDSQRCFVVCSLPHVHLSLSFRFICASFAANGPCPVRKWTISGLGSWSASFLLWRSGYISCVHWPFSVSMFSFYPSHLSRYEELNSESEY